MPGTHDPQRIAHTEAVALLQRLVESTRRDRAAFTLGYVLAIDAIAPYLPPDDIAYHLLRAQALHALSTKEFE